MIKLYLRLRNIGCVKLISMDIALCFTNQLKYTIFKLKLILAKNDNLSSQVIYSVGLYLDK